MRLIRFKIGISTVIAMASAVLPAVADLSLVGVFVVNDQVKICLVNNTTSSYFWLNEGTSRGDVTFKNNTWDRNSVTVEYRGDLIELRLKQQIEHRDRFTVEFSGKTGRKDEYEEAVDQAVEFILRNQGSKILDAPLSASLKIRLKNSLSASKNKSEVSKAAIDGGSTKARNNLDFSEEPSFYRDFELAVQIRLQSKIRNFLHNKAKNRGGSTYFDKDAN